MPHPENISPDTSVSATRRARWREAMPENKQCPAFEVRTRHSFFFPGEQYSPDFLEPLAVLARKGLGEVEFHLHHDDDTPAGLRRSLGDAYTETGTPTEIAADTLRGKLEVNVRIAVAS